MLFVIWYVRQERYIYFWDYDMYHSFYRGLGEELVRQPFKAIDSVVASVRNSQYNMLATLFQMPFYLFFGSNRLAYIASIAVIFAFPAIVLFTVLIRTLEGRDSVEKKPDDLALTFIALTVIALSPQTWVPVLRGYVDVVGLNVIFMILVLYFRKDWVDQVTRDLISLGLLLSLLILLRRWYAYWVVGFFFAASVSALVSYLQDRTQIKNLGLGFKNIVITGMSAVLSFFVVAMPVGATMLTTNHRDLYSAYRSSNSILLHVVLLYHHFGPLFIAASVMGLVTMAATARKGRVAFFIAVQFATTFILFTRTQDLNDHHYYWVSVTIFILTAFLLREAYLRLKTRPLKTAFVGALAAVFLAHFLIVFHPGVGSAVSSANVVFPHIRKYPAKRNDLDQVYSLLSALSGLTRDSDGKIYILASSITLNASIAVNGCADFDPPLTDLQWKVLPTHDVDKRDGFPFQLFEARYVVVTNPVGYHLAPEDQRVIGLLAGQLIKSEGLGRSYERLPFEFALEDGSTAYIYRKDKNFDAGDLRRISDTFVGFYPEHREKFEITPEMMRELSGLHPSRVAFQ